MRKKIIVLFLVILAGMWLIASENGWCRAKQWGRGPWDDNQIITLISVTVHHNVCSKVQNAAITDMPILDRQEALNRGEKSLNKKQESQVKLKSKL